MFNLKKYNLTHLLIIVIILMILFYFVQHNGENIYVDGFSPELQRSYPLKSQPERLSDVSGQYYSPIIKDYNDTLKITPMNGFDYDVSDDYLINNNINSKVDYSVSEKNSYIDPTSLINKLETITIDKTLLNESNDV